MINIIVAIDENFSIGYDNKLLYHIKDDMRRFKSLTLNSYCLMGRKTYESLKSPLSNRKNIIITRNKDYKIDIKTICKHDILIEHDVEKIVSLYKNTGQQEKELFVIGGTEIYKQLLPYADKIFLTFIASKVENADSFFPMLEIVKEFKVVKCVNKEENGVRFLYIDMERR